MPDQPDLPDEWIRAAELAIDGVGPEEPLRAYAYAVVAVLAPAVRVAAVDKYKRSLRDTLLIRERIAERAVISQGGETTSEKLADEVELTTIRSLIIALNSADSEEESNG